MFLNNVELMRIKSVTKNGTCPSRRSHLLMDTAWVYWIGGYKSYKKTIALFFSIDFSGNL